MPEGGTGKRRTRRKSRKKSQVTENNSGAINEAPSPTDAADASKSVKNQYHHYIPRFVLRNFALDSHLRHSKERHDIYLYSIKSKDLRIADVDKEYGIRNMYSDIENTKDVNYVEIELSKLEQTASKVINEFLDLSRDQFTIVSSELNSLKKFLYIMSFRHPRRRQQYLEGKFDGIGKSLETDFMNEKGRSTLGEVWLENMKGIVDTDISELIDQKNIGFMEGMDFLHVMMSNFVCIWEAAPGCEFIVTDNAFGIFEGDCGEGLWGQAYHYFYPVSPTRIIVQSKISYKSNEMAGVEYAKFARNALNLSTDNSLFPREIHNFPVAQYYGKRPGIGLLQDGKIRLGDPYADI